MKIKELNLIRFGPFSDLALRFEGGNLQIVFGLNEAGKSTTLRAVGDLLFGIPERSADGHLHGNQELRIGGVLETAAGRRLHILRRKGRKNTLLNPAGQPLDETTLAPFLAGLDRERFEMLFGLSHDRLVAGGRALLEGKGELGESLFGAGGGLGNLHRVRQELRREADDLFAPRASKPPLNQAIRRFQEARRLSQALALRPRDWEDLRRQLQAAEAEAARLHQAHRETGAELARLERLHRVLPLLAARDAGLARLVELGRAPDLADSAPEQRSRAQESLHRCGLREQRLHEERTRCRDRLAALDIPAALLAREDAIQALRDHLGAYRKARADLPGLQSQADAGRLEAREILRELGLPGDPDQAEASRVAAPDQNRIRRLGKEGARLDAEAAAAARERDSARAARAAAQRTLDRLPPARDPAALRRLAQTARRDDPQRRLADLDGEIAELRARLDDGLAALTLWSGPATALGALPLPTPESVERLRRHHDELTASQARLEERAAERRRALEDNAAAREALESQGSVPSEAELTAIRERRNRLWTRVRAAWLGHDPAPDPAALGGELDAAIQRADDLADRLRREADRAARHAALVAERQRLTASLAELDADRRRLECRQTELDGEWRSLWQPAGIIPLSPAEMGGWLSRHEKLVALVADCRARQRERDALAGELAAWQAACDRALADLQEPPAGPDEPYAALLERTLAVLAAMDATERERRQAERDLEQAGQRMAEAESQLETAAAALAGWRRRWAEAVIPLGLPPEATAEDAETVLERLERLFKALGQAADKRQRIDRIGAEAAEFGRWLTGLCADCAPQLAGLPVEEAAAGLIQRFEQARADRQEQHRLEERLRELDQELADLHRAREEAEAVLRRLLHEAGAARVEDLPEAERRAREQREIRKELDGVERQLRTEPVALDELLRQAAGLEADTLAMELPRLREQVERLDGRRRDQDRTVGELKTRLDAMDGGDAAAEAAAHAQQSLAEIRDLVERYVRIRLGGLVLGRELDAYRERHQGPVLSRAGALFSRMTLGGFTGLCGGFDDTDRQVLLGVRDDGRTVGVEGLSDGTRDQLYLALRLASLELQAQRGEPLPLVVDDVLINFDDARSRATLEILLELSVHTQVLFFTHHQRLAELAGQIPASAAGGPVLIELGA